jgi:hypothetical protein
MHTITKTLTAALALGTAVLAGSAASAQGWNTYNSGYGQVYGQGYDQGYGQPYGGGGYNNTYRDPREQQAINRDLVDSTCSGQRGAALENRLRSEVQYGRLNPGIARQMHDSIDQLQSRERRECSENDYRSARDIGKEYIRIRAWIDQETGGYRGNNRRGYYRR